MMRPPERDPDDPRNGPVLLRRHLIHDGWNDRAISAMVRHGQWVRPRRGAYIDAEIWAALDEQGRHGLRARAVQMQAKTRVVLSHVSGLAEYDVPGWGLDLSEVHVTHLDGRLGRREAGVRPHSGLVRPEEIVALNGVEVMNPTRLALETTTVAEVEPALAVVNDLLHRRLTTIAALEHGRAVMENWPHSLQTDLVLRLADARLESVGESRTLYLCFRQGLPAPVPQFEVRDRHGLVVARLDFAWPEHGVFVEFDGRIKYEKLLTPGERASDVVLREKRREEMICRLTGWRCVRLTWADLGRPRRTAQLIRDALEAAPSPSDASAS